ncbi:MAG: hypothetical protein WBA18_11795 [Terracidiphilus sp.]
MHELAILLQNQPNPEVIKEMMMWILPIMLIGYLLVVVLLIVPCWFICKKAGFSPWLSLLCIVASLGTLVLLYVLAFSQWKVVPAPQLGYMPPAPYPPQPPLPPQA